MARIIVQTDAGETVGEFADATGDPKHDEFVAPILLDEHPPDGDLMEALVEARRRDGRSPTGETKDEQIAELHRQIKQLKEENARLAHDWSGTGEVSFDLPARESR